MFSPSFQHSFTFSLCKQRKTIFFIILLPPLRERSVQNYQTKTKQQHSNKICHKFIKMQAIPLQGPKQGSWHCASTGAQSEAIFFNLTSMLLFSLAFEGRRGILHDL